jgi:hypothetical protein
MLFALINTFGLLLVRLDDMLGKILLKVCLNMLISLRLSLFIIFQIAHQSSSAELLGLEGIYFFLSC